MIVSSRLDWKSATGAIYGAAYGIDQAISRIVAASWQAKTAAKIALNNLAFESMRDGRAEMERKLHKPTNWTLKSWQVLKKAKSDNLESIVGWSDYFSNKWGQDALHLLAQQWNGGSRNYKRFETRLNRIGAMPDGMYAVPGKAAAELGMIDGYGNMKAAAIFSILSQVGAFTEGGYNTRWGGGRYGRKTPKKLMDRVYWAGKPGPNTPNGIWMIDEKHGKRGRLRPIIIFVRKPVYRARLDLNALHAKAAAKFPAEFATSFDRLMQQSGGKR